ncbi:hypothetical protein EJ08DRAFT_426532 [Tothia fuscella]|uniref:Methyltransferase n=1 Tax=Tothia fuscella TaxID=1048955 RepID=A0A9P4P0Y9_9PEZI|nr:hypothetical protein EJ08DRAFT_426532 [Tothia fuscella]
MMFAPTKSTFWYLDQLPVYQTTKPYIVNLPLSRVPAGKRTNQICAAYTDIVVRDIRAAETEYTLDRNGFELSRSIPMSLDYEDFRYPSKVRDIYCENVKHALVKMRGAELGDILHLAIRRRHVSFPQQPRGNEEAETAQPVQGVHYYTPTRAYQSLQKAFGDDQAAAFWKERRVEIIQVWRPIAGPVLDWPLGVCDRNSVDEAIDLVSTDNVWTHMVAETYNLFHNPKHLWYFVSKQIESDALLFKGFDNMDGKASFCPHAAFELDNMGANGKMRESVECAILLVHPLPRSEGDLDLA